MALEALGAAGGIAQGATGLAAMLGAFDESAPTTDDLAWNDYWAKKNMAPDIYRAASQANPWFQSLGSQAFQTALQGAAGHQETVQVKDPASDKWETRTFWVPETQGALQTYQQTLPQLGAANQAATRAAMPETYSLLGQAGSMLGNVAGAANREMGYGAALSPAVRREITQAALSNPALSSFGAQPRDAYTAYANLGTAAENRMRQRWGDVGSAASALSGLGEIYGSMAQPGLNQTFNQAGNLMSSNLNANMQTNPGWWDPFNSSTGALNMLASNMGFDQSQTNQSIKVGGAKQLANSFSSMGSLGSLFGGGGS